MAKRETCLFFYLPFPSSPACFLFSPLLSQPCSRKDETPWERDCFPASLRSEHTRWQVAATRCGDDKSLRVYWRILSPKKVARKQIRLNLCDLLPTKTKICTWIHQHTRSDLSPRRVTQLVAASYRPTCTHGVICRREALQRRVA